MQRIRTLRIRGLQHFYGTGELRKQVLFDNQLDRVRGEIVIMTGPSGFGQNHAAHADRRPAHRARRQAQVLGRELSGLAAHELVNGPPRHRLHLSGPQSLRLADGPAERHDGDGAVSHDAGGNARTAGDGVLTRLGLATTACTTSPHSLSGGQKQRVAIARALAHRPADPLGRRTDRRARREIGARRGDVVPRSSPKKTRRRC